MDCVDYTWLRTSLSVQYGMVRYGTVRYGTVWYSTVQYSTVQYSTVHANLTSHCSVFCSEERGGIFFRNAGTVSVLYYYYYYYYYYFLSWTHVNT